MKAILTLGLVLATLTAYPQNPGGFSYKDLGLGYNVFPYSPPPNTEKVASPRELLNEEGADSMHISMVRGFAERFPGQEAVVLTSSLLETLAATKNKAAGVHLFLGSKDGKLEVILTHTRIDTLKVDSTFATLRNSLLLDSASNYTFVNDQAYYWDVRKQYWREVQDKGKLQQNVKTSREQAQEQYGYRTQGYYLSKDLLLKIWKQSNQESLTIFLGQADDDFHLIIPILQKSESTMRVIHFATDYRQTRRSYYRTLQNPIISLGSEPKDHNTIRHCPTNCPDSQEQP